MLPSTAFSEQFGLQAGSFEFDEMSATAASLVADLLIPPQVLQPDAAKDKRDAESRIT